MRAFRFLLIALWSWSIVVTTPLATAQEGSASKSKGTITTVQQLLATPPNKETQQRAQQLLDSLEAARPSQEELRQVLILRAKLFSFSRHYVDAVSTLERANAIRCDESTLIPLATSCLDTYQYFRTEQCTNSVRRLNRVKRLHNTLLSDWRYLEGRMALSVGLCWDALAFFQEADKLQSSDLTATWLAYTYQALHQDKQYLLAMDKAMELLKNGRCAPDNAWWLFILQAKQAMQGRQIEKAEHLLMQSRMYRDDDFARTLIAGLWDGYKLRKRSEACLNRLFQLGQKQCAPQMLWWAYFMRGKWAEEQHSQAKALSYYKQTESLSTSDGAYSTLASQLLLAKQPQLADRCIKKAFQLYKENKGTTSQLIQLISLRERSTGYARQGTKVLPYLKLAESECFDYSQLLALAQNFVYYGFYEHADLCAARAIRLIIEQEEGTSELLAQLYLIREQASIDNKRWTDATSWLDLASEVVHDQPTIATIAGSYAYLAGFLAKTAEGTAQKCANHGLAFLKREETDANSSTINTFIDTYLQFANYLVQEQQDDQANDCVERSIALLAHHSIRDHGRDKDRIAQIWQIYNALTAAPKHKDRYVKAISYLDKTIVHLKDKQSGSKKNAPHSSLLGSLGLLKVQLTIAMGDQAQSEKYINEMDISNSSAAMNTQPLEVKTAIAQTLYDRKRYLETEKFVSEILASLPKTESTGRQQLTFLAGQAALSLNRTPQVLAYVGQLKGVDGINKLITLAGQCLSDENKARLGVEITDQALKLSQTEKCSPTVMRSIYMLKGHSLARNGLPAKAITFIKRANTIKRGLDSLNALANLSAGLGATSEALSYLEQAELYSKSCQDPEAHRDILLLKSAVLEQLPGNKITKHADIAKAISLIKEAAQIRCDSDCLLKLVEATSIDQQWDESLRYWKKARACVADPAIRAKFANRWLTVAHSNLARKRFLEARRFAEEAKIDLPIDGTICLAAIDEQLGNYRQAANYLKEAVQLSTRQQRPRAVVSLQWARCLAMDNRLKEAITVLDDLVTVQPTELIGRVLLERAAINLQLGNKDRVAKDLRALQEKYPEKHYTIADVQSASLVFSHDLASLLNVVQGPDNKELERLDKKIALAHDRRAAAACLENKARIELEQTMYTQAKADIERSIELGNDSFSVHALLAAVLYGLGEEEKAKLERLQTVRLFGKQSASTTSAL